MSNMHLKRSLSHQDLMILESEMDKHKKSKPVAFVLWLFTGGLGGHRYYLGDIGYAIAMTLTLGGLGFWALIDVFFISGRVDKKAEIKERELIVSLGIGGKELQEEARIDLEIN
ncbi:hypothetical protein GCM10007275_00550 [Jeotgalicoccus coquinae]|uniref:TM2 domain-containing protein n=1 Tax=Jeotgalicoccus coquinae TaxID=709509 RepID=A0A6V7RRU1_9STAP|nr:TM2 domain-containing protein [Jeotgalicoccus coquinae]MBB6423281.1 hypothetical protein [Jeotgalicoccus coquinae]GGE09259.1 hypothetical protein GCM10007275_00550 [Jeotgalicoccus coquinae]CAD2081823.1 hypothetical protein JEOCOQ751_02169 [Jeotgalicoccus coquinae]